MPQSSYFLIASIPQPLLAGLNSFNTSKPVTAQNLLEPHLEQVLATNTKNFIEAAKLALTSGADYVEWRADSPIFNWPDLCLNLPTLQEKITKIFQQIPDEINSRTIFTWRGAADKGGAFIPPSAYQTLLNIAAKQFAYVDVEVNLFSKSADPLYTYTEFLSAVPLPNRLVSLHIYDYADNYDASIAHIPGIAVSTDDLLLPSKFAELSSYPELWKAIIEWLQSFPAGLTKLAIACENPRQIAAFKTAVTQVLSIKPNLPLIAVVMGESYASARVELAELGGWGVFAIAPGFSATALGQQTIQELLANRKR